MVGGGGEMKKESGAASRRVNVGILQVRILMVENVRVKSLLIEVTASRYIALVD
jgi:hypothetical protein